MSGKCSVCSLTCENFKEFQLHAEDFQFFPIPRGNLLIRRRWIEFCGDSVMVSDDNRICSMHFLPQDFLIAAGEGARLKENGEKMENFIEN